MSIAQTLAYNLISSRLDHCNSLLYGAPAATVDKLQSAQNNAARAVLSANGRPMPDHYFDNSTGFQYANSSSTGPRCWHVEWTRLVSRPTWRNISFNASHLVRSAQLHHRYCLSRDWSLISQDVHSPTPHLSFGTVCLQKSCCAIWNIVLKDILRHSCLIAVTRPSDRYLTSASVAFHRHIWIWHSINY